MKFNNAYDWEIKLGIHVQTFSHKARNPVSNDKTLPIFITG